MTDEISFASERDYMVETQIVGRGVRDKRLLDALRSVPRHCFVSPEYSYLAYADGPLPIGNGQTISQPYIVALMTELLELRGHEKVLEIGTGSGYQAAVLSLLCREVHTIERHPNLARYAARLLEELGYDNVQVHVGDGSLGLAEFSPYEAIIVTAAAPQVPSSFFNQLIQGGRLVIPVGGRGNQYLELWTRQEQGYHSENILPVAFVPLIGEQGWKE